MGRSEHKERSTVCLLAIFTRPIFTRPAAIARYMRANRWSIYVRTCVPPAGAVLSMAKAEQHDPVPKPRLLSHTFFDTMMTSGALLVITFLTGILLSRILGPEGRGQYGSILFWGQFGGAFLTFSLFEATIIKLRARGGDARDYLPSILVLALGLGLFATLVGLTLIMTGVIEVAGVPLSLVMLGIIAFLWIAVFQYGFLAIEAANLRFHIVNLERVVCPLLYLLAVTVLWLLDESALLIFISLYLLTKLPVLVLMIYRGRKHFKRPLDRPMMRESSKFAVRLTVPRTAASLAGEADRLVIVPLWSAEMLGYYFVAMSTCGAALSLAAQAIQVTLLPSLSGLPLEEKRHKVEQLIRLSTLVAIGVVVALWIAAPFLVPLVFGEEFRPAVIYVQGLVFASALRPIISIVNIANYSSERTLPGVHMAIAFLVVFGAGFLLTGFDEPREFFIALGFANCANIAVGFYHLARKDELRIGREIIPGPKDVVFLIAAFWRYGRSMMAAPLAKLGRDSK